jgi:uncharacterized protein with GYD domain
MMPTYILLGTLTEEGAEHLREHPEWLDHVNRELEELNVKIVNQFAVLGQYDIITIVDAPDNRTMVRVSTQLTLRGNLKIITLPALPVSDFIAGLQ